jgi:DNA polymerase I
MSQNHLYLIDGSGYIFRAYHRLPPLTNPQGTPVGAVFGYTSMIWKLAEALHKADGPTHMAVVLDSPGGSFRNDIYPAYKAQRPPAPEDLKPQFPLIRDATRAFSLPCIELAGFEADDLIASYATAAMAQGWKVTIVSSDKDLMQLVEDGRLDMLDTMHNRRITSTQVHEKFAVPPEQLGDVLGLMGDAVDNVPGVPGVGPKTAAKLITEHGDIEAVLGAAHAMKPSKLRENLLNFAEQARLSRVLVELKRDVPLPQPLDEMALKDIPPAPLAAFLQLHGFRTLLAKVQGGVDTYAPAPKAAPAATPAAPATPEVQVFNHEAYACVQSLAALETWVAQARTAGTIAFDTETDSLDAITGKLVGVSLALAPNRACYIPLGHGGKDLLDEVPEQIPFAAALALLKPLLEDASVLKIGHNLKYDLNVFAQHGIKVAPYDDTLLMSFNLDAGRHNHGMDELSARYLGHMPISFADVCGKGKSALSFAQVPLNRATSYAAEDADVTLRLYHLFKARMPLEGASRVYARVDRPLPQIIADMERAGVLVDRQVLANLSQEFGAGLQVLEQEIYALAGSPFTIGSPKQLGEILFERMGLKGGRKGKSGEYSTDVTELERLAGEGIVLAQKVLEWRQLAKLKSTYTDTLVEQINPHTGRVHTSYSLSGAQTGRLASNEPNLMNIPIRTSAGRRIRQAFVASPGHVILSADYSQVELRLAAHIADVPQLREAFQRDEDIHAMTAQELFGEVNRDTRAQAKTINFSLLYGISSWGLAQRLEISPAQAKAMIDRYFERFPGISRYISETIAETKACGFTTTLFGRKCHFTRINAASQGERAGSERAAINAPIQGSAADLIKRAMARMPQALEAAGLGAVKMLLQVHDELVFEVPHELVEAVKPVIAHVMENAAEPAFTLSVPLKVDIGTGANWDAAH